MPFFIRQPTKRKLRKNGVASHKLKDSASKKKKTNVIQENEIESESDDSVENDQASSSEDEDKYITAQEKKVKLAKKYLQDVELEEREKLNNERNINSIVLKRLRDDELEKAGKLKKKIAENVQFDGENVINLQCKQHSLSVCCLVVSRDNQTLFSSSKDLSIVRWSLTNRCKTNFIQFRPKKNGATDNCNSYHNSIINCLDVSRDDKYLVSGDEKGVINVWQSDCLKHVHTFQAHKNAVTDVVVCRETNSMYSTSKDALVKVWSLDELAYVDALSAHQSTISSVDLLNKNRLVTSGGTDKMIIIWKNQGESYTVHKGHDGNFDLVKKLDEEHFVSCGDDGALCLWGALKKSPIHVVKTAHGECPQNGEPNWITALAVYPNSDLVASGSCDGHIRLWKWSQNARVIASLSVIPVAGYVNEIQFTSDGCYLVAAIGREHRLGRWQTLKEAKNRIICIPMKIGSQKR